MRATRGRSSAAARRIGGALVAVTLLLGAVGAVPAGADTKTDLARAKARLTELEHQIEAQRAQLAVLQREQDAQQARLSDLQGQLNALATKIDTAQNAYDATVAQVGITERQIRRAQRQY